MVGHRSRLQLAPRPPRERRLALKAAGLVGLAAALPWTRALSQASSPSQVRLVIPYPPGGSTDIAGRLFATSVGKLLGKTFVPDNRAGAAGLIGMQEVSRAPADGATLGISGIGTTVLLGLTKEQMPYVFDRDLDVIAHLGSFGNLVVTRPDAPFTTLPELVKLAQAKPGSINCGTPPLGSPSHMTLQYLRDEAKFEAVGVPYQGHTQIMTAVLAGEIQIGLVSVPQAQELVRTGKLKALAVTSAERSSALPQVPTVDESGFRGFEASLWNILVARRGVPRDWLAQLNRATNEAFATADMRRQLEQQSIDFTPHTVAQAQAFVAKEQAKWQRVAKVSGIVPE